MKLQRQCSQLEGDEAGFKGRQKSCVHITIIAETQGLPPSVDHSSVANSRNHFYI